jgi:DNA-binding XRE family transcriptional regulator
MKTANNIKALLKTEIDKDVYDPKRLLEAVTDLICARPVEQLQHAVETLYEFYHAHHQPLGGAIVRAVEILETFLSTLEEITTIPGPVNGAYGHQVAFVGKKIRALRIAAGHDEKLVADTIGIELSYLQRIEQGQCGDMRMSLMTEFALYFDVSVKTLFLAIPPETLKGHADT